MNRTRRTRCVSYSTVDRIAVIITTLRTRCEIQCTPLFIGRMLIGVRVNGYEIAVDEVLLCFTVKYALP